MMRSRYALYQVALALFVLLVPTLSRATGIIPEPNANAVSLATRSNPEILTLDARDAGRGLMTATMRIPVRPGPFTFVYPEWIPGEHGPTGPLADISQLRVSANGKPLTWRRDKVDMYAFHVEVPSGVTALRCSSRCWSIRRRRLSMST
ncbi:peptidase M61 domain protein, partial [mine drainage metagenome]